MIKNKELFSDLDEGFLADVCNANSSRAEIRGRGTVSCFVKDNTGRSCLLERRDAFWVPSYARNLVSVKRLTDKRAMIQFNDDPTIKMPNGTVVPMMTNDELFSVMAQPVETGSLSMMHHSIKHWHQVMGHNTFHDTYSPTAKLSTLRTVLACEVKLGMHFNQMDIKTAYLNAPIHEDVYMGQPEGYQKGKQMACKLKRSLYGLKQSGRNSFECVTSHLFELNFKASFHDPCLLTLTRNGHKC